MPGKSKRRLRPFIEKSRKRDQGGAPGVSARHFLSSSSTSSYFLSRFLPLPPLPFFSLPFFFFFLFNSGASNYNSHETLVLRDTSPPLASPFLHLSPSTAMDDIPSRTRFSSHCFIPSPKNTPPPPRSATRTVAFVANVVDVESFAEEL